MSLASARHMTAVAEAGCVIGNRGLGACSGSVEVHHVAEGSGERSDLSTAGLCTEHHRGESGIHGMGTKAFLRLYRLPTEYHLLIMANEDMAKRKKAA